MPTVEACAPCHGVLNDFDDVMAKRRLRRRRRRRGRADEVEGLLALLEQTIIDASATPDARAALEADFEGQLGVATVTTVAQRKAGYNWAYVSFDGSKGVHNATYAVQLLQQSILFLNPGALSDALHPARRASDSCRARAGGRSLRPGAEPRDAGRVV